MTQGTLLATKKLTTKFGEKVLAEVQLETGEIIQVWETPRVEGCISQLPEKSVIEVEKTAKGSFKWLAGALTGTAKKKAIADYSDKQIKFLVYLHKKVEQTFIEQGIELSEEITKKYAVTVYLGTKKEFNL